MKLQSSKYDKAEGCKRERKKSKFLDLKMTMKMINLRRKT